MRHELKYTRQSQLAWCTCGQWRMKYITLPWIQEPSPELRKNTERLLEEFDRHKQESK